MVQQHDVEILAAKIQALEEEITLLEKSNDSLRESESKYRDLVESAPDLFYRTDLQGLITYISPSVHRLSGYTVEEATGMKMAEEVYLIPEEREIFLSTLQKHGRVENFQAQLKRKDGSVWWASTNAHFFKNRDGNIQGVEGITRDISDLKAAEQKTLESGELYRNLFETDLVGIFRTRIGDGTFIKANRAAAKLLGYSGAEDLIKNCKASELYPPHERQKYIDRLQKYGSASGMEAHYTLRDGSEIDVSVSARLFPEKGYLEGIITDITELKRAEEALRQSEEKLARVKRMESLGLMAGGIAHDLNNILSGVVSYPDLLLIDLPDSSPLRKPILTIRDSGQKAADIVSDLLTIAKGAAIDKKTASLNRGLQDYLRSAEHQKLENTYPLIQIEVRKGKDLLNIKCSLVHIKKVLMNLVANAAEAIEGQGTITISTSNVYVDEPLKGYDNVRMGEYVLLTIADDGVGIDPTDLERIFEPFYTKKVMGRSGTGLGLAVVWNTVREHEGYINVESSQTGTKFELYFPTTRDETPLDTGQMPLEEYKGNGQKILVVDDEIHQREISCHLLNKIGYQATAVPSGEKALAYLAENETHLVILDMIMPNGMSGRETFMEIRNVCPGQRVLIASGYAETQDVKEIQKLGAGQFLKKPYTIEKLGVAVRDELRG